jgi:hypothetical protein
MAYWKVDLGDLGEETLPVGESSIFSRLTGETGGLLEGGLRDPAEETLPVNVVLFQT